MNLKKEPIIMGILNVTPDSFYDGGEFDVVYNAIKRAKEMITEGATIIDVGGESTGPESGDVSEEEELGRVIPILKGIREKGKGEREENNSCSFSLIPNPFFPIISVDTYKAPIARIAIEAGATIINDVTAGRGDPNMFALIAETGCNYVMMHSKDGTARTTIHEKQYEDVMKTIIKFFEDRIHNAEEDGINRTQLILDPGLGHFISSDPKYSWEVLERLEELQIFGCPILVSPSRKSFTAEHPKQPPSERLSGTLKATKLALENDATIVRTHDVRETKKVLQQLKSSSQFQ